MPPTGAAGPKPSPRPTEPPANAGARVGRTLDNAGRKAGDVGRQAAAPLVSKGQRAAVSGGSIVIGMVAYAVGVAYMQHGWPGVTGWLKAKLFNETSQPPSAVPALLFHTGAGAGGVPITGTQQTAATPPAQPTAPTPSGGTLYA